MSLCHNGAHVKTPMLGVCLGLNVAAIICLGLKSLSYYAL